MSRVFASRPGDHGSISGPVIPKTQKMVLDAVLTLSIIRWGSRVKWSNPGNGVAPSPTPLCSSYWKGSPTTKVVNFTYYHYKVTLIARISLTFSLYPSLSYTSLSRSSKLHPVSAKRWCKPFWFFSGVWITAIFLKSPWLFSVFHPILIKLKFLLVLWFPNLPVLWPVLWELYQVH